MTEVVSVRFKNKGKVYFFDPSGIAVKSGENVIVETVKGLEFAECTIGNHEVDDSEVIPPLRPIIRVATQEDVALNDENKRHEKEAFEICQEKILKHEMDMKLVDVEYSFDGNKILFFFTSDGRVDFRDLVKDLASVFKTRIELRQIGVRDEARMIGGLGICGRPFCCSQFLDEFQPVSIKMAKTQGLSLNPTKISGTCGRLMCCLKYEQCAYESLVKKAPKVDAFVNTPSGKGSVTSVDLLRGNVKVRLEDTLDTQLKTFSFDELEVLGGKAKRAEYLQLKAEGKIVEEPIIPAKKHVVAPVTERAEHQNIYDWCDTELEPKVEQPRHEQQRHDKKPREQKNRQPQQRGPHDGGRPQQKQGKARQKLSVKQDGKELENKSADVKAQVNHVDGKNENKLRKGNYHKKRGGGKKAPGGAHDGVKEQPRKQKKDKPAE